VSARHFSSNTLRQADSFNLKDLFDVYFRYFNFGSALKGLLAGET